MLESFLGTRGILVNRIDNKQTKTCQMKISYMKKNDPEIMGTDN